MKGNFEQLEAISFPAYCIDSSSLIELKRYPMDVFPSIWRNLDSMARDNELISPIEVYKEVEIIEDEIYRWCKKHKKKRKIFVEIDDCQINELQSVQKEYDKSYWEQEVNKTTPWADPWLVTLAICKKAMIVTEEKNVPNRIPYIATSFNIKSLTLLDFFREKGIEL